LSDSGVLFFYNSKIAEWQQADKHLNVQKQKSPALGRTGQKRNIFVETGDFFSKPFPCKKMHFFECIVPFFQQKTPFF
jgi:hypothetical protein